MRQHLSSREGVTETDVFRESCWVCSVFPEGEGEKDHYSFEEGLWNHDSHQKALCES